MKKLFYFAAAAVALAACAKNEVIPVNSGENQEITFNVAPKTKATINKFANDLSFKSYAYYLPGEETWDNHTTDPALYINGAEIANTKPNETDGVWKAKDENKTYYWPKNGSLTFFAWTSLKETVGDPNSYKVSYVDNVTCSNTTGIKVENYEVDSEKNKNVDLLVAEIKADQKANTTTTEAGKYYNDGVPTLFRHKLSYVVFKVNTLKDYSKDGKKFTLNYIKFNNIEHKGTYQQLPTEGWNSEPSEKTEQTYIGTDKVFGYVDPESEIPALTTDATQNYYLPQTFGTSEELEIKYTITTTTKTETGTTAETSDDVVIKKIVLNPASVGGVTPPSLFTKWERGKKYTVTLTFSLDEIFWDPAVENWEEVSAPTSGLTTI